MYGLNMRTEIPEPDFIETAHHFSPAQARNPEIVREFREDMANLARWMSKMKIHGKLRINRGLTKELIKAFDEVSFEVFVAGNISGSKSDLIFFLWHEQHRPSRSGIVEKPHKGRLILMRDGNGELCIPHPAAFIPLNLDSFNVKLIPGKVGRNIARAYSEGLSDARKGMSMPAHTQRERDRKTLIDAQASADIETYDAAVLKAEKRARQLRAERQAAERQAAHDRAIMLRLFQAAQQEVTPYSRLRIVWSRSEKPPQFPVFYAQLTAAQNAAPRAAHG